MRASKLIELLQTMINEDGDLPVVSHDGRDPSDLHEVSPQCTTANYFTESSYEQDKKVFIL